jgi:hypothetical protein
MKWRFVPTTRYAAPGWSVPSVTGTNVVDEPDVSCFRSESPLGGGAKYAVRGDVDVPPPVCTVIGPDVVTAPAGTVTRSRLWLV